MKLILRIRLESAYAILKDPLESSESQGNESARGDFHETAVPETLIPLYCAVILYFIASCFALWIE